MNLVNNKLKEEKHLRQKNSAFTLMEMSLVVLILGLLAASFSYGYVLVEQSQIKESVKMADEFKSNIVTFKDKFGFFPGDLPNATRFWNGSTNGNGNSKIDSVAPWREEIALWNHLNRSEIIQMPYEGDVSQGHELGTNFPRSKIDSGGFVAMSMTVYGQEGELIQLASSDGNFLQSGILNAKNAAALDLKFDDGLADSGQIYSSKGNGLGAGNCTTGSISDNSSSFIIGDNSKSCRIFFWIEKG